MIKRIINISPKVGALSSSELSNVDIEDLCDYSEVYTSRCCDLDDAYTSLIYRLANKFADDILSSYQKYIERSGKKFSFGLHYENGRKEHGFQLIIDFDHVDLVEYQNFLVKYFDWDFIQYESDLSFNDIYDTIF